MNEWPLFCYAFWERDSQFPITGRGFWFHSIEEIDFGTFSHWAELPEPPRLENGK